MHVCKPDWVRMKAIIQKSFPWTQGSSLLAPNHLRPSSRKLPFECKSNNWHLLWRVDHRLDYCMAMEPTLSSGSGHLCSTAKRQRFYLRLEHGCTGSCLQVYSCCWSIQDTVFPFSNVQMCTCLSSDSCLPTCIILSCKPSPLSSRDYPGCSQPCPCISWRFSGWDLVGWF